MLHALQDFYSHSNWVENHLLPGAEFITPDQIPIYAGLVTKDGQGKFHAGPLKANKKFVAPTLECIFGVPTAFVGDDLTKLSTAYFPSKPLAKGKCRHDEDLNKDSPHENLLGYVSPRGATNYLGFLMTEFAQDPARRHTRRIVEDILQAIDDRSGGNALFALLLRTLLTEDNPTFVISVDRTATMAEEIAGLQSAIATKVDEFEAAGAVPRLGLVSFADDVTDEGTVTGLGDLDAFTALVDGLSASGGGDCPNASLSAIERGLATMPSGGAVLTITDASPREGSAAAARLTDVAREQDIALHFLLTGDCGDGGAIYRQMAADTGGNVFWANGGSSGSAEAAASELIDDADPNLVTVLSVQQPIAANGSRSWSVPVDAELSRVDFILARLSGGSPSLQVFDPSAVPVSVTNLGMVQVVRVTNPTPGAWTMTVSGDATLSSEYAAVVQGLSGLALVEFSHAEPLSGAPTGEHPPVTFFNASPLRDSPVAVTAVVTGTSQAEVFELIDLADCAVDPPPVPSTCTSSAGLPLTEESAGRFVGAYTPTQPGPLLARVRGTDGDGHPMQRVLRRPIRSSTLHVRPPAPPPLAVPGSSVSTQFEITNGGAAGTFAVEAVSASGFAASVGTPTLTLASGATAQVSAMVTVPLGTPPGEGPLLLRVTSTSDASITNMGATILRVPAGTLALAAAELSVGESGGSVVVTVTRTDGAAGTVSVDYATTDAAAKAGSDYTASSGTLTFAPGQMSRTFSVPIANDSAAESSEAFIVGLDNFSGGALPGDVLTARVTILDDEPCTAGWGPFPDDDDTGIVPANALASKCEQKIAKGGAKLIKALLKCHTAQVAALAKSESFDEEGCEATAIDGFLAKSDTSECACADPSAVAATTATLLDANNALIYCDPAGTPIGGDDSGRVPSTAAIRKCEDKIAKQAAKLAKAWAKCHIAFAKCKVPMDESLCEERAIQKFLDKVSALQGCGGCEDVPNLVGTIETLLDGGNIAVFCE